MGKNPTILVADDDRDILEALQLMLELGSYSVQTEANGHEVVKKVRELRPDLLLLDIWMAGASGLDVVEEIRKQKDIKDTPVVLISAGSSGKATALKAGANDFIAKPFDMKDLLQKVKTYIKKPQKN